MSLGVTLENLNIPQRPNRSERPPLLPDYRAGRPLWKVLEELMTPRVTKVMPTMDEAWYRVKAIESGDPVSERGPGMGVPTFSGEDWLTAALDAITPMPVFPAMTAVRNATKTLPGQVSTRYPTAIVAKEDPMTHDLVVGYGSAMLDPKAFEKNAALVGAYPQVSLPSAAAERQAETYIERARENLNRLYEEVPPEIRQETKLWYEGANRLAQEASEKYGISPETASGVYAALSPQKDWYMNVSLGDRLLDALLTKPGTGWTREMDKTLDRFKSGAKGKAKDALERIRGKDLTDLETEQQRAFWVRTFDEAHNPRSYQSVTPTGTRGDLVMTGTGRPTKAAWGSFPTISSAISMIENPALENISRRLGQQHKVRSFYNNIIAPLSERGDVTIDTHAVAAGLLSPYAGSDIPVLHNFASAPKGLPGPGSSSVYGSRGTYGLNAEIYRRAAEDQGLLPREMQSITWEAVRGLFNNKSDRIKAAAADILGDYSRGLITQRQAQDRIFDLAGGINRPTWMQ